MSSIDNFKMSKNKDPAKLDNYPGIIKLFLPSVYDLPSYQVIICSQSLLKHRIITLSTLFVIFNCAIDRQV